MYETLILLNTDGLLTPITTIISAALALLAVFLNNSATRKNLIKELEFQVKQSNKKISLERVSERQKEQREKILQSFENLLEFSEKQSETYRNIIFFSSKYEKNNTYKKLYEIREKKLKTQSVLIKSYALGCTYSNKKELHFEFNRLIHLNNRFEREVKKITNSFYIADEIDDIYKISKTIINKYVAKLASIELEIKRSIDAISNLIITELQSPEE